MVRDLRYYLQNGMVQDWVQLPTPEERRQWEKKNTTMIVTPIRRKYNDSRTKNRLESYTRSDCHGNTLCDCPI